MKRLLKAYPTVFMLFAFFMTSCVFAYCQPLVKIFACAASFICVLLFLLPAVLRVLFGSDRDIRLSAVLIAFAVTASAAVSFAAFDVSLRKFSSAASQTETARLYISGTEREYPNIAYYNAVIEDSSLIPKGTKIILASSVTGLEDGSIVVGEVTYSSLEERSTSVFDGKGYYLPKKVMIFAETEEVDKIGVENRFSLSGFFEGLREKTASAIRAHCGKDAGSLTATVLLGSKKNLNPSVKHDFRRLGISHLLVISGMHFSFVITFSEFVLRRFRIRQKSRAIVNIVVSLMFMGIAGLSPSVIRAGIMHMIAQFSRLVLRKPNTINAYALSGTLLLLINPYTVLDMGFQMSYVSTLACIVYCTNRGAIGFRLPMLGSCKLRPLLRAVSYVTESVTLTLAVTLFMLTLSWAYFGELSLASIPANIVAAPLIAILMLLGAVYLITYPLTVFIFPLSRLINLLGDLIIKAADTASDIGGVILRIDYGFTPFFIAAIVVLLLVFPLVKRKRAVAASAVSVFAALIFFSLVSTEIGKSVTHFSYVSLGKNEGFVLTSDGKTVIADMSNASFGFSYELLREADTNRAAEIEALVLTHYHNKHISYFGNLCEREVVCSIILPEPVNKTETAIYNGLCDTAEEYGVDVYTLSADESYTVGCASIGIYPREYLKRTSHPVGGAIVRVKDDELLVVTASFSEGNEKISADMTGAEYVFIGDHSPVCKKEFTVDTDGSLKSLILGESAREYLRDDSAENVADKISTDGIFRVKWYK